MINKGAMFGLDARIALAIFGALSVISGAALFSAIQSSQVTKTITQLSELNKSYEAYYLDTGEELDYDSVNSAFLNAEEIITSSKNGWKGPYLNLEATSTYILDYQDPIWLGFVAARDDTWAGNSVSDYIDAKCNGGSIGGNCYIWSMIVLNKNAGDLALANAVDEQIDGAIGHTDGSVRIFIGNPSLRYYLLLKGKKHSIL